MGGALLAQLIGGKRRHHVVELLGLQAICPTLPGIALLSPRMPCGWWEVSEGDGDTGEPSARLT